MKYTTATLPLDIVMGPSGDTLSSSEGSGSLPTTGAESLLFVFGEEGLSLSSTSSHISLSSASPRHVRSEGAEGLKVRFKTDLIDSPDLSLASFHLRADEEDYLLTSDSADPLRALLKGRFAIYMKNLAPRSIDEMKAFLTRVNEMRCSNKEFSLFESSIDRGYFADALELVRQEILLPTDQIDITGLIYLMASSKYKSQDLMASDTPWDLKAIADSLESERQEKGHDSILQTIAYRGFLVEFIKVLEHEGLLFNYEALIQHSGATLFDFCFKNQMYAELFVLLSVRVKYEFEERRFFELPATVSDDDKRLLAEKMLFKDMLFYEEFKNAAFVNNRHWFYEALYAGRLNTVIALLVNFDLIGAFVGPFRAMNDVHGSLLRGALEAADFRTVKTILDCRLYNTYFQNEMNATSDSLMLIALKGMVQKQATIGVSAVAESTDAPLPKKDYFSLYSSILETMMSEGGFGFYNENKEGLSAYEFARHHLNQYDWLKKGLATVFSSKVESETDFVLDLIPLSLPGYAAFRHSSLPDSDEDANLFTEVPKYRKTK